MKNHSFLFLLITLIFAACSSSPPTSNTVNANLSQNQSSPSLPTAINPTETLLALNKAAREKSPAAVKSLVSKGTLEMMEKNAKEQNTTVDELLRNDENAPFDELPETRNEKIEGDKATIEVKNKLLNEWITLPFTKENGIWKVAVDRYIEDMKQKMLEEMKQPPDGEQNKKN